MSKLQRRSIIKLAAASSFAAILPRASFAKLPGTRNERFILVIIRGAMDGLGAVVPLNDPDYATARGSLAFSQTSKLLTLDQRFSLNPALFPIHSWFEEGSLSVAHAIASPYRERSHFDAQNLLENGTDHAGSTNSGWLNRTLGVLGVDQWSALAVSEQMPLVLQGSARAANWHPDGERHASASILAAANHMYATDPAMAAALGAALENEKNMEAVKDVKTAFPSLARAAGKILAQPSGANLCVLEIDGWDTHVGQGTDTGRLANVLGGFAQGLAALREELGEYWKSSAIAAITEFGRTVHSNGTGGTDHGTATAAFLMGGSINGGKTLSDWPGLSQGALYQGRDLAPTADIRSVLKGILSDHLKITSKDISNTIFPNSSKISTMQGLIKA